MIQKAFRIARAAPNFARWRALGYTRSSHLKGLRGLNGEQAVSLRYWRNAGAVLNFIFGATDSLFSVTTQTSTSHDKPKIADLEAIFDSNEFGGWRLELSAVQFLWKSLLVDQPRVMLECGSGLSTLVLATYAAKSSNEGRPTTLLSLDQNASFLAETEKVIKAHGLGKYVQFFVAALDSRTTYDLSGLPLQAALAQRNVDWVLIDGPVGRSGCRAHTLPDLAPYCRPGARWFLDDSFRDAELNILSNWSERPGLAVDGILPTEKGLATGTVVTPAGNG